MLECGCKSGPIGCDCAIKTCTYLNVRVDVRVEIGVDGGEDVRVDIRVDTRVNGRVDKRGYVTVDVP